MLCQVFSVVFFFFIMLIPIFITARSAKGKRRRKIEIKVNKEKEDAIVEIPIRLSSENAGVVHWFYEVILMFRPMWLKNNPRGNYLLVKATYMAESIIFFSAVVFGVLTLLWFWLYHGSLTKGLTVLQNAVEGNNTSDHLPQIYLTIVAFWSAILWNLHNMFHQKWRYCADAFNSTKERSSLSNDTLNLAYDLLVLDLWAHRSFDYFFGMILTNAAQRIFEFKPGDASEITGSDTINDFVKKLNDTNVNEDTVQKIIEAAYEVLPLTTNVESPSNFA